jgi:hypothetical protein
VLAHVLAFEPGFDVAAGFVGAALTFCGLAVGALTREASRLASLACASPGVGSVGNWYFVWFRMALMTRCTSRSG